MTDKQLINEQHGTMTKRTQDEILARIKELEPNDFFGHQCSDLAQFLTFENAKPWLKEGVTSEQWQQLTDPVKCIRDYMNFAWGKANDCRGLSASRSIQHMQAWVWLDGKDELADRLEDVYEFYGKPCLVLVCQEYGIDWKELDNDSWADDKSNTDITAEEALKRKGITTHKQSVMCDNDIEHFYIYAKEFTLPITLKSLIESHKNLHQQNKIKHDEWLRELSAARELGRKQGLEMVSEHEFVSVEKLKSMTINELVSFLYDGENKMTDKQLIKDVLELLQLIHTSHHTVLATNPPTDPWVYHKVSWKIEDMETRLNNKLRAETEQPTTRKLGFDDALKIAHGCFDYMGGYRDDNLYIYHHGIQTVVNCLESAKEKGLKDSQIRAVHIIGTEAIRREMEQPQKTNQ